MYEEVEAVLDEYVRPLLRSHAGDVEIVGVSEGTARLRMKGRCAGCPAADLTAESLIQAELTRHLPGIRRAVLIQEASPALIDQARAVLRLRRGG